MNDNRDYDKFTKNLTKLFFTLEEIRGFIEHDLVESVIQENPDQVYPKNTRYTVKLTNGDTYNVYVK